MTDRIFFSFRTPKAFLERLESVGAQRGWTAARTALRCLEIALELNKSSRSEVDRLIPSMPRRGERNGNLSWAVPPEIKAGAQAVADARDWRLSDAGNFLLHVGLHHFEGEANEQRSPAKAKRPSRAA